MQEANTLFNIAENPVREWISHISGVEVDKTSDQTEPIIIKYQGRPGKYLKFDLTISNVVKKVSLDKYSTSRDAINETLSVIRFCLTKVYDIIFKTNKEVQEKMRNVALSFDPETLSFYAEYAHDYVKQLNIATELIDQIKKQLKAEITEEDRQKFTEMLKNYSAIKKLRNDQIPKKNVQEEILEGNKKLLNMPRIKINISVIDRQTSLPSIGRGEF